MSATMPTDRRRFLAGAGLAAGAAMGGIPSFLARAMAIPAHRVTGTIRDVEHVVILMQENRSFDHYFGALRGVRGFGDPRPLRLPGGAPVWAQPSAEHPDGHVLPFHGDSRTSNAYVVDGSDQGHQAAITIVNGGRYDQWGASGELHKRMAFYRGTDLPFYYALANAFTVCDAYHCSTLTQTYPNRLHLWTGCNGGGTVGGDPEMSNYGEDETPSADMAEDRPMANGPHAWTTYAERLEAAGVSWKIYQEYDNFGDNILSVFAPFRPCGKDSPLYARARSWVSEHKTGPDRKRSDGEQLVEAFRADLAAGTLPQVSWIVPAADLSEHPTAVPSKGEHLTARLIEALVDHPDMFAKTVFILNYDEAGGFYDHMPPPMPPLTPDQGHSTVPVHGEAKTYPPGARDDEHKPLPNIGTFPIGLGIRVPAIVVSPWSRGGYVCSQTFDHTSVLRFLETRFGVKEPNISAWRRTVCGDLTACFDFSTPDRDAAGFSLPDTADYAARIARSIASPGLRIPDRQSMAQQDQGQQPARALPYRLAALARPEADGLWIDLVNGGSAGAAFHIVDATDRGGPWRYTIGAGEQYSAGQWHGLGNDRHDLIVHGPNGFHRRFAGRAGDALVLGLAETVDAAGVATVVLAVANRAAAPRSVRISFDPAYRIEDPRLRQVTLAIGAGQSASARWALGASDNWYALRVVADGLADFAHEYAGHVETGRASHTDPAIGATSRQVV